MDLIDEFMELTALDPSPPIFRKWAAISLVSSALSRKVWSRVVAVPTYPNLYVVLVGLPASGKTVAIKAAQRFATARFDPDVLAPDSLTGRRLTHRLSIDEGTEAKIDIKIPRQEILSKLVVFSSEFSTFVKEYDQDIMKVISDLFDCPEFYSHETQNYGEDHIYNCYLTILGGVQPWYFGKLPHTAFEQGFMTRLILVHSDAVLRPDLFKPADEKVAADRVTLIEARLDNIVNMVGEFFWYPVAKERLSEWYAKADKTASTHPMLSGYNRRRLELLIRLCMISAAARRAVNEVGPEDVDRAAAWLAEAEATMPAALETAGASPYRHHEVMLVKAAHAEFKRTGNSLLEPTLRRQLARNVPPNILDRLLDGLVAQGYLLEVGEGKPPHRRFLPGKEIDA